MTRFYSKAIIALTISIFTTFISLGSSPENLQKAWDAFNRNQRTEARELFVKATASASTKAEANLGLSLIHI